MDVTVTVDTSLAHLAGVLGQRTWALLPRTSIRPGWGRFVPRIPPAVQLDPMLAETLFSPGAYSENA
jgi:ADP-heptose:LPS heptosyltransferase